MSGTLYIVPTPIGNLEDMTLRGIRILKEVDFILAEDTRQSAKLLKHYQISNKVFAHHKFNEKQSAQEVVKRISAGENAALISDAGTPLISDPGSILVKLCAEEGITISCLPGANSVLPALAMSGMDTTAFLFIGFLPFKKGRKKLLEQLAEEKRTLVLFESPHKLLKTLTQLAEFLGNQRQCAISREISKIYEETYRGKLQDAIEHFKIQAPKGEFVLVLSGA